MIFYVEVHTGTVVIMTNERSRIKCELIGTCLHPVNYFKIRLNILPLL